MLRQILLNPLEVKPKTHCGHGECSDYPLFGVAPHICFWRKETAITRLGGSTIKPPEEWPENFLLEIEPEKPLKQQLTQALCGVYFCPKCKGGISSARDTLIGKVELSLRMKRDGLLD
jgi:hypothetical protein